MIDLDLLEVTHNDLRRHDVICEMIEHVANGGFWNAEALAEYISKNPRHAGRVSPLIQLSQFEDGRIFIHDGHHRSVSICLAGRTFLHDSEYVLTKWKYVDYTEISHKNGWYTPFDPRVHCRTPNFAKFKVEAKQKFIDLNGADEEPVHQWILGNANIFCEPRRIRTVQELASCVKCPV